MLLSSFMLLAQDKKANETTTKAEEFSATSGTLLEKNFNDLGAVKGVKIRVIKVTDIISSVSVSYLQFEYETGGTYSSTKVAGLDKDELDGLIKSLKALQETVFPTQRDKYTEISYKSRSGFEAGTYFDVSKSKWNCFLRIDKYDGKSLVFLNQDDFSTVLKLVEQAKGMM